MSTAAEAEKLCSICGRLLPVRVFRFRCRASGIRHNECLRCNNDRRNLRTAMIREQDLNAFWQGVNRNGGLQRYPKVEALATAAVTRFGGLDRLVRFWRETTELAQTQGKPHLVVRSLEALAHLMVVAAKSRETATEESREGLARMSDEELRDAELHSVKMAIRENPELAVAAAAELGWTVVPPDDAGDNQEDDADV